ncbi:MAG: hypothetical protein A4E45_00814 [Methanosaeta sp. PtaB.Bin039]|nr:MAG: hypothetical protein A4E45_00814 [Methanosaeta sp. PtaB.Bin039]
MHIGNNTLAYRYVECHDVWIINSHILQLHVFLNFLLVFGSAGHLYHDEAVSDLLISLVIYRSYPECEALLRLEFASFLFFHCSPLYSLLETSSDLFHRHA